MFKNKLLLSVVSLDITSTFLDSIFSTVIIILLSGSDKSTTLLPLMTMLMFLPTVLAMFFGSIADNTRNRIKYIILSNVMRVGLFAYIAYLTKDVLNNQVLLILIIVYVTINLFGSFENSLFVPVIPSLVTEEQLPVVFSQISALQSGIGVMAPIIGSICLQFIAFSKLSLIVAGIEGVIVCCLLLLRPILRLKLNAYYTENVATPVESTEPLEKRTIMSNIINGTKDIMKCDKLRLPLFFIVIYNGLASSTLLIMPLLVSKYENFRLINLSYTISTISALTGAAVFIGGLFLSKYLTKIDFKYVNLMAFTSWIGIFISALIINIYLFVVFLIIMALLSAILAAQIKTIIMTSFSRELLSSYIGFLNSILGLSPIIFTSVLSLIIYWQSDITTVIMYYLLPLSLVVWLTAVKYALGKK